MEKNIYSGVRLSVKALTWGIMLGLTALAVLIILAALSGANINN